jgi:hypothetical protein
LHKVKWGLVNAKKNNTEIEQEQKKVFQEAGKAGYNNSTVGSNQNETQLTEGRY